MIQKYKYKYENSKYPGRRADDTINSTGTASFLVSVQKYYYVISTCTGILI